MKATDDLHKLIKSLSKNEKGYFKKHSSAYSLRGKNNYIRLFDAIEKQKSYDEQKIKQQFKGELFIKQLHVTKNYLNTLILNSLASYQKSIDLKLNELLSHIEVLFNKGLIQQCEKLIARTRELAQKHDRYPVLITLHTWELKIIKYTDDYDRVEQYITSGYNSVYEKIQRLKEEFKIDELQLKVFHLQANERYIRGEKQLSRFNELMKNPMLKDENRFHTFLSRNAFFLTHALYCLSNGQLEKSYYYRKRLVEEWEKRPYVITANPWGYARMLINFTIINIELKKFDTALKALEKAAEVKINNPLWAADRMLAVYAYRLEIYYRSGQYTNGYNLLGEIKNKVIELDAGPNSKRTLALFMFASLLCFSTGHYSKCLWWLNAVLNSTKKDVFDQEFAFARILQLMVHYELENESLLESAVKSTYRFLYKRDKLYKFEKLLLDFIRKSFRITAANELKKEAQLLKKEIVKLYNDPNEKRIAELFMLDKWLDKKF